MILRRQPLTALVRRLASDAATQGANYLEDLEATGSMQTRSGGQRGESKRSDSRQQQRSNVDVESSFTVLQIFDYFCVFGRIPDFGNFQKFGIQRLRQFYILSFMF